MKILFSLFASVLISLNLTAQNNMVKLNIHAEFGLGVSLLEEIFFIEPTDDIFTGFTRISNAKIGPVVKWGLQLNTSLSESVEMHLGALYSSEAWEGDYENNMGDVIGASPQTRFTLYHWEFPMGVRYRVNDQIDLGLQNAIRIFNKQQAWPDVSDVHHFEDSFFSPAMEAGYRTPLNDQYALRFALHTQWIRQNLERAKGFSYWTYGVMVGLEL